MRRRTRRPHGGTHSTPASLAPCRHCRRELLHAWDEGLLVRADAAPVDEPVAAVLRDLGRAVYVLTAGRSLVRETAERVGSLRNVTSRHVAHECPAEPPASPVRYEKVGLFDLDGVQPARGNGGMW